ncbi:MAG: class I SAM-dependent methyltransferase [Pseudomonadota bacterium]
MGELIETWANRADEEDSMTADHAWIWREMIAAAVPDPAGLAGKRVLDVGCNQGGFLRMLHDTRPVAEAVGIDLAAQAVALAEQRKGARPITYRAAPRIAEAGSGFDIAFSHEVIYLIPDLEDHARQVASVLRPGATYYAVTGCHSDNPLWPVWLPRLREISNLPVPDHSVGDIATAFRKAGFEVAASRFLADKPVPLPGPSDYMPTDLDRIDVYARWKLMFCCTRPV